MQLKVERTLKAAVLPWACAAFLAACGGGSSSSDSSAGETNPSASSGSAQSDATVSYEALLRDLDDGRTAVQVLPASAYATPSVVSAAAIEDEAVDDHELLRRLVARVTQDAQGDQGRVEAWVRYLQDRIAHPKTVPTMDDGEMVYDPYWILEHRLGQCGQTNRVLADGLAAAGYRTRAVQLMAHVAAEVWYDNEWHYVDADWLNDGQFVRRADGTLPSALEIHEHPELLAGLDPDSEFRRYPVDVLTPGAPGFFDMFSTVPYYYVKTATPEQERDAYYGWDHYETVSM